jgi:hypothetical protein
MTESFGFEPKWGKGWVVDGVRDNPPQLRVDRAAMARRASQRRTEPSEADDD